jgi:hypothetical protein
MRTVNNWHPHHSEFSLADSDAQMITDAPRSLDRRQFLKASLFAAILGGVASACSDRDSETVDRPELLTMLGPDRVRALGTRYRAQVRAEDSTRVLHAAIDNARSTLHLPWPRKSIGETVRDDFTGGRMVLVDGWVLSVTEARQCALFSLAFV